MRLDAATMLMKSIQLNQLIGHDNGESDLSSTTEDIDLEEEDG